MCLYTVSERRERGRKMEVWKVFNVEKRWQARSRTWKKVLSGPTYGGHYIEGKRYRAQGEEREGESYRLGFHAFLTRADARRYYRFAGFGAGKSVVRRCTLWVHTLGVQAVGSLALKACVGQTMIVHKVKR